MQKLIEERVLNTRADQTRKIIPACICVLAFRPYHHGSILNPAILAVRIFTYEKEAESKIPTLGRKKRKIEDREASRIDNPFRGQKKKREADRGNKIRNGN